MRRPYRTALVRVIRSDEAANDAQEFYRAVDAAKPSAAEREAAMVRQTHLMEVARPSELLMAMGWSKA